MTKTELMKLVGRKEFTVREFAALAGPSVEAARSRIASLQSQGLITRTSEVQQYVGPEGRATRGRPSHLYRLL
jgi:predicted ArsR family transcriptional regulator